MTSCAIAITFSFSSGTGSRTGTAGASSVPDAREVPVHGVRDMTQTFSRKIAGLAAGALLTAVCLPQAAAQSPDDTNLLPPQPWPAEMKPRAAEDLALGVTWTGERYVVVGDRGHVLLSNDGKDWVQVPAPVRAALAAVTFPTPQQGWAVGHDAAILHSDDGGQTWTLQHFDAGLETPFHDVYFVDERRGIAIGGYGLAMITEDGGQTWQELDAPAIREDEFHLAKVTRLDDGRFFVAGEFGLLAVADDLQGPWQRLMPPYDSSFFGALPMNGGGVLIYGLRGNVFVADDLAAVPPLPEDLDMAVTRGDELTGEGWRTIDTRSVNSMFGGVRLDDGSFLLVGLNGELLQLDERGELVGAQRTDARLPLAGAHPGPNGSLLLVGEDGIEYFKRR